MCVTQRKSPGKDVRLCLHAVSSYSGVRGILHQVSHRLHACTHTRLRVRMHRNEFTGGGRVLELEELPGDVSIERKGKGVIEDFFRSDVWLLERNSFADSAV